MYITKEIVTEVLSPICQDIEFYEFKEQLTVTVPKDKIVEVATALRDNPKTAFNQLRDVTAVDWLKKKNRFEVVYFLYSLDLLHRLRVKVAVDESDLTCDSVTGVWESANWYERETFDMYGVKFTGHPDLRRFYMPEDYVDPDTKEPIHPLRKDFPLMGIPESLPLPPYPEKYGATK